MLYVDGWDGTCRDRTERDRIGRDSYHQAPTGSRDFLKIPIPEFSKILSQDFWDFVKPLNDCFLRLLTPVIDHNNLF